MYRAIVNGIIFTGKEILTGKALILENGTIRAVVNAKEIPGEIETINCEGNNISPGFIDLQIAGSGGYLFSANLTREALDKIEESIVRTGTTGFLLVLPTNSPEIYDGAFRVAAERGREAFLGLHLEGPFINLSKKGAHDADFIRKAEIKEVESLLSGSAGTIKMMTVAPEMCSSEIILAIVGAGIVVCAGHSNATFNEANDGFRSGIRSVTHLFNAMSPIHHRDAGLPGAAFLSETAFASIVADGIHVDFSMVSIAKRIMKERLFLVSDAVEESNQKAVRHVRKADRFTLPDGTLSGSALTMIRAVQNCVSHAGISLDEALRMASLYPAMLMGLNDRGRIEPGMRADLVVFDREFVVRKVLLNGKEY